MTLLSCLELVKRAQRFTSTAWEGVWEWASGSQSRCPSYPFFSLCFFSSSSCSSRFPPSQVYLCLAPALFPSASNVPPQWLQLSFPLGFSFHSVENIPAGHRKYGHPAHLPRSPQAAAKGNPPLHLLASQLQCQLHLPVLLPPGPHPFPIFSRKAREFMKRNPLLETSQDFSRYLLWITCGKPPNWHRPRVAQDWQHVLWCLV